MSKRANPLRIANPSTSLNLTDRAVCRFGGVLVLAIYDEASGLLWLSYWSATEEKPTGLVAWEHVAGNWWREVHRRLRADGTSEFSYSAPLEIDPGHLVYMAGSREEYGNDRRFRQIMAAMGW